MDTEHKTSLFVPPPKGHRVGVVESANPKAVRLIGYGVVGDEMVPPPGSPLTDVMHDKGIKTPALHLDSGDTVLGCDVWWAPENSIRRWIGDRRVIIVQPKRTVEVPEDSHTDDVHENAFLTSRAHNALEAYVEELTDGTE